jgi:ribose 5-phosphate isomerase B
VKVALACDHGGILLKEAVVEAIKAAGYIPVDFSSSNAKDDDYPDYALQVGQAIAEGRADRGILICGSGVGACIAANKIRGIYAAVCHDVYSAHQGVEHDDMNVLCLGARVVGTEVARELVGAFLAAKFSGAERHLRRVAKVRKMEADSMGKSG